MTKKKKIEQYKEAFGQFLCNKRVEHSLTQEQLAHKLGNNRQNISALERGKMNPSLIRLKDIAEAFDMTTGKLLKEFDDWLGL